jgi:hypothetical protein
MAKLRWGYDQGAKRYRDLKSGRFLTNTTITSLRDRVVAAAAQEARALAKQAASGSITPAAFQSGMRDLLRNIHGSEAIFGRGGVNAMSAADWGRLGTTLRNQYGFLDGFVQALKVPGAVSEAQAMARAELYVGAAIKSYEQGRAAAFGVAGQLPLYPGDNCLGHGNCRCRWEIQEDASEIRAYWRLGGGDACEPCQGNATTYDPFVITKPETIAEARPVRLVAIARGAAA